MLAILARWLRVWLIGWLRLRFRRNRFGPGVDQGRFRKETALRFPSVAVSQPQKGHAVTEAIIRAHICPSDFVVKDIVSVVWLAMQQTRCVRFSSSDRLVVEPEGCGGTEKCVAVELTMMEGLERGLFKGREETILLPSSLHSSVVCPRRSKQGLSAWPACPSPPEDPTVDEVHARGWLVLASPCNHAAIDAARCRRGHDAASPKHCAA